MMQHNLICNYLKIINITFATYIWQSYTSFYLIQSRIPLLWKQNSVFIRRHLVFSAFFCSFIFTLSSVLFIVQNDFDFTTWYECVKNTLLLLLPQQSSYIVIWHNHIKWLIILTVWLRPAQISNFYWICYNNIIPLVQIYHVLTFLW